MTTLKEVQQDAVLGERFPALVQAASAVGSYRHQTMGCLAGNICQNTRCRHFNQTYEWRQARSLCYKAGGEDCHAVGRKDVCFSTYSGDVAPSLLVLDASAVVQGPAGARELPLGGIYTKEGKNPLALGDAEIITAVRLPDETGNGRSQYEKHSLRGSIDFPIVGAAVWRDQESMRVAFTAVDRAPVRASVLEGEMDGREITDELLAEVAPLAAKSARVTKTTVQPVTYKRDLMAALFLRAARALA
jgi:4-hydroxybenzoyl-CoA reductase subunit beta